MVRLTFLCHASTAATRSAAFPQDEPLDPMGVEEAKALAPAIGRFDAALTSPARRARETADCLGLSARVEPALADLDCGRWAGLTLKDLALSEQPAVSRWMSNPSAAPHGGESLSALMTRMADFLGGLSTIGRPIAITHAAPIRAAIVVALGAPAEAFWRIDIAPLTRVVLHGENRVWRLREILSRG